MKRLTVLLALLTLNLSCNGRGTDEAGMFVPVKRDNQEERVSFDFLRTQVLAPGRCLNCHSDMGSEPGLAAYINPGNPEASPLYQEIASRRMPLGGPALPDSKVEWVRQYILGLRKEDVPQAPPISEPTPGPEISPIPFASPVPPRMLTPYERVHTSLIAKSCLPCHATGNRGNLVVLDTYDALVKSAEDAWLQIDLGEMPPVRSRAPRPTPEVVSEFRTWIDEGFRNSN